jgi:hypothetical protein
MASTITRFEFSGFVSMGTPKSHVYAHPVGNKGKLHHRIVDTRQTIGKFPSVFEHMRQVHIEVSMESGGLHYEHVFYFLFFYYLVCETNGTAATPGLLCQPRVIMKMIVEKQMECILVGETEVLGENLPQRHFCPSQNPK